MDKNHKKTGGWYCFTCDSTPKEQLMSARRIKRDHGYQVFCPIRTEWRSANKYEKARRSKVEKQYAIYPGYVFIRMARNHLASFFRDKPDTIYEVLSIDQEPYICSDSLIRSEAAKHGQEFAPAHYRYQQTGYEFDVGEKAILERLGSDVVVLEINGSRVRAECELLGRMVPVNVEAWELKKVS